MEKTDNMLDEIEYSTYCYRYNYYYCSPFFRYSYLSRNWGINV